MVLFKRTLLFHILMLVLCCHLITGENDCDKDTLPEGCKCETAISHDTAITCTGLETFPDIPAGVKNIFFTSCKFNKIGGENVPNAMAATVLQITNSEVTTIEEDAFKYTTNLQQLDLSGNAITNLSSSVFLETPQLVQLDLNRNRFTNLPDDLFSYLPKLEKLHLEDNSIARLPDNIFTNNTKLTEVDVSGNQLPEVPAAVKMLPNITRLVMASNSIGDLQNNAFKELTSLTELELGYCDINKIDDGAFTGLNQITFLRLDSNHLKHLSPQALAPMKKSLKRVWLNNNEFKTLQEGTLPMGGVLTELKLGRNPWHCDKNIAWMKDLQLNKIDHENVTCKTPSHFEGFPIGNLTKEMLEAEDNGMKSMIAAAIALPIIAICIVIIFIIIYKLVQSRRQQKRASFRYSAVYRDTVESAYPPPKQRPTSEI